MPAIKIKGAYTIFVHHESDSVFIDLSGSDINSREDLYRYKDDIPLDQAVSLAKLYATQHGYSFNTDNIPASIEAFPWNGKWCSVCGEPQYTTYSGDCCHNGHGGAPERIGRKGVFGRSKWLEEHCKCGCRLRSDGSIVWCSGVECSYWRKAKITEGVNYHD